MGRKDYNLFPLGRKMNFDAKTVFQVRNTGNVPLKFIIIATMPPWPGASEANAETGIW